MDQFRKLYWPLGISALCLVLALMLGASYVNLGAVVFKFLLVSSALSFVHMCRLRLWPKTDMSQMYLNMRIEQWPWVLGTFYFYVELVKAIVGAF